MKKLNPDGGTVPANSGQCAYAAVRRSWFGGACRQLPAVGISRRELTLGGLASLAILASNATATGKVRLPAGMSPEDVILLTLKSGDVYIRLFTREAPEHAKRIRTLVRQRFYDGLVFHRVIPGFMAQTGDPLGNGSGGSSLPDLRAEFSSQPFRRGTVGMARSASPHSANSQFFICFEPAPWLDGQYTAIGEVFDGMKFVDRIAPGEPPQVPDRIVRAQVAADVQSH